MDIKKVFSKNAGSLVLGFSRTIEHPPWGRRRQRGWRGGKGEREEGQEGGEERDRREGKE